MPKYSIILPVRNGGHYLKKCVNSILSQTYTNFDFLILDNCSTDDSLAWLLTLKDERIKIIPAQQPLTIEESWGRVINITKNEFITLIGHDDILHPDFLQTIDDLVIQNPDASLYHTHFNFIDGGGKIIRPAKQMQTKYTGAEFVTAFLNNTLDSMGTGYVMRSKDYDALGGIQQKYPNLLFADFELWISLAVKSFAVVANKNCFAFRLHQSTTYTSQDKKLHTGLDFFVDFLMKLKNENSAFSGVIEQYGSQFLLHYCTAYAHRMLRSTLKMRNGLTVDQLIKQTVAMADKLSIGDLYVPQKKSSLQLAKRIDKNIVLRYLFLWFKKIYTKPVL